jgi:hypothetical protein
MPVVVVVEETGPVEQVDLAVVELQELQPQEMELLALQIQAAVVVAAVEAVEMVRQEDLVL